MARKTTVFIFNVWVRSPAKYNGNLNILLLNLPFISLIIHKSPTGYTCYFFCFNYLCMTIQVKFITVNLTVYFCQQDTCGDTRWREWHGVIFVWVNGWLWLPIKGKMVKRTASLISRTFQWRRQTKVFLFLVIWPQLFKG